MAGHEDFPPLRTFGLRDAAQRNLSRTGSSVRAARRTETTGRAGPEPLAVYYTWKIGLLGASVLGLAYKFAAFALVTPVPARPGQFVEMGDTSPFLFAAALLVFIGLGWIMRSLSRAPALKIDATGVSGFTLLGTKHIAWADLDRVQVSWQHIYKQNIIFHARTWSPSGGLVTGIQLPLGQVNSSQEAILRSLRSYQPGVRVEETGKPGALYHFLVWYSKLWQRATGA